MGWPTFPTTDPVLIFALVMIIILVAPLVCARLRAPGLIGLIVAGALVGPGGLNLMARGETMSLLGTVGLLYIVFTAALEMDLGQFIRYRHRSIIFGFAAFALPQLLGALIAYHALGFAPAPAILLGAMLGSHTLLTYPIASRLGIAKDPAVVTVVGGTIISDTAALMMLAVVARGAAGEIGAAFWLQFLVSIAAFLALLVWGLPRLGRWFFRNVLAESSAQFAFVLACVFTFAYLAQQAGMQALIGAFLAGLALNRLIPPSSPLMNRIQFVGHALFIPFFLLSVGMLVDVRVFVAGWSSWAVALVMVGVVVTTKFAASMLSMRIFRFTRDQGLVMFGLSVNKAAATLAVVFVGVELGLFDRVVLNGAVMLIVVTSLLGAWVTERYGRRIATQEEDAPREELDRPERILVPLANPATATVLTDLALMVRSPGSHEPIHPLTVARDDVDVEQQVARSEKLLASAVVHATAADVPVSPVTRVDGNVASGIVRAVQELRASNVVVGWDGRPASRWHVLGRTLDDVIGQTAQMVMACRVPGALNVTARVVVLVPPYADREPGFREAVRAIKNLAHELGAPLLLVSEERVLGRIEAIFTAQRPEVPIAGHVISSWNALPAELPHARGEPDLVVLLSAREGRVAWRPNLDSLPRRIAGMWPQLGFIVVYPAEVDVGPADVRLRSPALLARAARTGPAQRSEQAEHLERAPAPFEPRADDIHLDLGGSDVRETVRALLVHSLNGRPAILETALADMLASLSSFSVEVTRGVVLLHAHVPELAEPRLQVGIHRGGLAFPHVTDPVHVVLVLLGPRADRGERHLATLSRVARMVRPPQLVEELLAASSAQEARAVLLRGVAARKTVP